MKSQLQQTSPIHQAAMLLEEAIARLEDALAESERGPEVEKQEQSLRSIRNELERLQRAEDAGDIGQVLNELGHLCDKVAKATRKFNSMFITV